MKAAVFYGSGGFRQERHPVPRPREGQILFRVLASGICGGEYNITRRWEGRPLPHEGIILGHEIAAEVVEDAAGRLKPGTLAAISPNRGCGYCWFCRHDLANVCGNRAPNTAATGGGYAEYCLAFPDQCFVPETSLPAEELALAEPLACCIHSLNRAALSPGEKVLIIGAGGGAQLFAQLANVYGASQVTVADSIVRRLETARKMGADRVINTDQEELDSSGDTDGGFDVVIVTRSSAEYLEKAFSCCAWRGRVLCYGVMEPGINARIEPNLIWKKQ
ncbi:MAG: alcohol dehydrogenase catalytic domain-containing protein, partial [Treponema sp.]|nr:alcohol dehydrogenase catalytic domain-containing protein [Treponema sp.]